eukprot:g6610.t1
MLDDASEDLQERVRKTRTLTRPSSAPASGRGRDTGGVEHSRPFTGGYRAGRWRPAPRAFAPCAACAACTACACATGIPKAPRAAASAGAPYGRGNAPPMPPPPAEVESLRANVLAKMQERRIPTARTTCLWRGRRTLRKHSQGRNSERYGSPRGCFTRAMVPDEKFWRNFLQPKGQSSERLHKIRLSLFLQAIERHSTSFEEFLENTRRLKEMTCQADSIRRAGEE